MLLERPGARGEGNTVDLAQRGEPGEGGCVDSDHRPLGPEAISHPVESLRFVAISENSSSKIPPNLASYSLEKPVPSSMHGGMVAAAMRVTCTIAMLLLGVDLITAAPRPTDRISPPPVARPVMRPAVHSRVTSLECRSPSATRGRTLSSIHTARLNAVSHQPVTAATIFHIASISKNILAGAIVRLAEQHRLRLDDVVTKYVPNAPTRGAVITVRQLLNHTSGFYSFTSRDDAEANEEKVWSHDQVIGLSKDHAPDFSQGHRGVIATPASTSPVWSSRR